MRTQRAGGRIKNFALLFLVIGLHLYLSGCVGVTSPTGQAQTASTVTAGTTTAGTTLDIDPPAVANITSSSALISWGTNIPASSQVEYGPTSSYGSQTGLDATLATNHAQALTGLQAGQLYHFRVDSADAKQNQVKSGDLTFTTLSAPDTTPPVVSVTAPSSGAAVSGTIVVAASATDNVGVASVQFQVDGGDIGGAIISAPYNLSLNTAGRSQTAVIPSTP